MNKTTMTLKVLAVAAAFLALAGCNKISRDAESSSVIIIESLTGTTVDGEDAAYLQSDVLDADGLVRLNNATANLVVRLISPNASAPSQFNDVVLTTYRVTYELPTGPGTPGTDVPMPFDGNFSTILCPVDDTTTVPFVVVLESAKQAAPLVGLIGTSTVLERRAKIEIFGHDLSDRQVSATGYLTIYFADYQTTAPVKK
ncbi:MAG TPA: hypothetical protein P5119_06825 [Candidatus Aminicenantes bacterium]|nr:hypothetical protein [Candidatus Aminicenantes bacterium]HRY65041.1 hypothetical protein [Candidatus Aminicenantes bacterium]HRZ71954.1 hypothetical protein [Candidatus Aminicenantes bacterium]